MPTIRYASILQARVPRAAATAVAAATGGRGGLRCRAHGIRLHVPSRDLASACCPPHAGVLSSHAPRRPSYPARCAALLATRGAPCAHARAHAGRDADPVPCAVPPIQEDALDDADAATDTTPLRPAATDESPEKARSRLSAVKGILSKTRTGVGVGNGGAAGQGGDIEMRRLVWADEASEGAQPLEEEFVIPSRPARLRRRMASASPALCIVVTITLALLLFWKAIFAS